MNDQTECPTETHSVCVFECVSLAIDLSGCWWFMTAR